MAAEGAFTGDTEGGAAPTTSQSISSVALEVTNTLLVSFVVTEVLLRKRSWREVRLPVGVFAGVNASLSPRIWDFLGAAFAVAAGGFAGTSDELAAAATAVSGSRVPSAAAGGGLPALSLTSPVVRGMLRLFAVAAGFAALAYFDVRHLRQQPYTLKAFAREFRGAVWHVFPVFPFLVVGFSCAFLVVASVLTMLGLPAPLGEELIFYGQFYAPFSAVYWTIKKDWLKTGSGAPPLPLHGDTAGSQRLRGSNR